MIKKRIHEYDLIRALATLCVIVIHTSAPATMSFETLSFQTLPVIYLNRLLTFVVPVFLYLAGSVVSDTNEKRPFVYKRFLMSKFKRIIVPYLLISLVYYLLITFVKGRAIDIQDLLMQLLTGSAQYHLYFIPILIQLYLLTPIFIWLKKKVTLTVLLPLLIFLSYIGNLKALFQFSDRIFFKYMIPYLIGLYFGRNLIEWLKSLKWKVYLIILLTVLAGGVYSYSYMKSLSGGTLYNFWIISSWYVYGIMACLTLTRCASILVGNRKLVTLSSEFSVLSYTIYLIHPLMIALIVQMMSYFVIESPNIEFAISTVFTVATSMIIAKMLTRLISKV